MPNPTVETMWQEIRVLKQRICELEEQMAKCPPCDEDDTVETGWIDYDGIYVTDSDGVVVVYA